MRKKWDHRPRPRFALSFRTEPRKVGPGCIRASDLGRVPNEQAVNDGGTRARIPGSYCSSEIVSCVVDEAAINQHRMTILPNAERTTDMAARIPLKSTVHNRWRTTKNVVDTTAVVAGDVVGEGAVYQHGVRILLIEHAAAFPRFVPAEGTIRYRRAAGVVVHPATREIDAVSAEGAVGHRRVAIIVKHPAANKTNAREERANATGDRETFQHRIRSLCTGTGNPRAGLLSIDDRHVRAVSAVHPDGLAEEVDGLVIGAWMDLHLVTIHGRIDRRLNGRKVAGDVEYVGRGGACPANETETHRSDRRDCEARLEPHRSTSSKVETVQW